MNCDQVRELLPDLAAGTGTTTEEVEQHLGACSGCAAKLQGFRQTMSLLDEWHAPEPSAYFDTRLSARLREEMACPAAGWLQWFRQPAFALSMAAALLAGAFVFSNRAVLFPGPEETLAINVPVPGLPALPGTAVGDLQALEKNNELYADFDVLDELQVQDEVTANP
jgi:anti-sigma factor RsiW